MGGSFGEDYVLNLTVADSGLHRQIGDVESPAGHGVRRQSSGVQAGLPEAGLKNRCGVLCTSAPNTADGQSYAVSAIRDRGTQ